MLGISGLASRIALILGERDGENSQHISIGGLDVSEGLNGALFDDYG